MEVEQLIMSHRRYALAVGNRVGHTLDRDERDGVVHLALVEAAWDWVKKSEQKGEFKSYLARIVETRVRRAAATGRRQTSRNERDGQFARMMFEFAEARQKRVEALEQGELAELAELKRAQGYGVSLDRLRGTQIVFADSEASLDSPVYEEGEGTLADVLDDSLAWRWNPEQILIAKEERTQEKEDHAPSLEKQRQLLATWIGWLPKEFRQVWMWHLWTERWYRPDFRSLCARRYGGTKNGDSGLAITPTEAEYRYEGGLVLLRAFARGDFSKASFEEAVRNVPAPLIQRYVDEVADPLVVYVMRKRLLTTYENTIKRGDRVYTAKARPTLTGVARVWHKRVEKRLGRNLTREEVVKEVEQALEQGCRGLAVKVGIAPPQVLKS